ncbi:MAG: ParB/Srx family N-terminal domain-containing protein [Brasilonema octagenarum HA4186-MV1]|jgi:ParB-like chromosome segregation protein Spo0J|nr:ParB/Srx family N-terminal domain-containing protein [Brasilonema octagenarum HA4186-MV1]
MTETYKTIKQGENWELIAIDPRALKPYPQNAKIHTQAQIAKLTNIIKKLGFDVPIVCDENLEIIKGHARQEAAILAEFEKIPVIIRQGLSESDKRLLRVSDNQIAESSYDPEMLRLELTDLLGMDVDMLLTGFDADEIDNLLKEVQPPDDFDEIDENKMKQELDITCPKCGFVFKSKKTG